MHNVFLTNKHPCNTYFNYTTLSTNYTYLHLNKQNYLTPLYLDVIVFFCFVHELLITPTAVLQL